MGFLAAFLALALLHAAVCCVLCRLTALLQQKKWEHSTLGSIPDLPGLRRGFFIGWLLSLLPAAWFLTSLLNFPAQR